MLHLVLKCGAKGTKRTILSLSLVFGIRKGADITILSLVRAFREKEVKIRLIFKYIMIVLTWKQNLTSKTRNSICLRECLFMQYC